MRNFIYSVGGAYTVLLGGILVYKGEIGLIPAICIGFCGLVTLTQVMKNKQQNGEKV